MNIRALLRLRETGDDPWTPGEFAAILRYLLVDERGNGPVSQVEIIDAIGALLTAEAHEEA